MRRFVFTSLVSAMLFCVAGGASATDLKVMGGLDVYGMWSSNLRDFDSGAADGDNYMTTQRFNTYFSYVANENLKAVLGLEANVVWGQGDGGDWGSDGTDYLSIKHAYLDFNFPDTQINVKAGQQAVSLPSVFGNPVFDEDASAILVSAPIDDMFGVMLGYSRGYDGNDNYDTASGDGSDDMDVALLAVPVTLDGFSVTPYFVYAWLGRDAMNDMESLPYTDDATVWAVGANAELTLFDPLTVAADLIYGDMEGEYLGGEVSSQGWYAALAASYKMDMLTASLFGVYFSGYDEDGVGALPQLAEGWGVTPYIGGVRAFSTTYDTFSGIDNACWVAGLKFTDVQFAENLTHDLTIAYARGTSDEGLGLTFDENASAWEVYLVNKYAIYENLVAINEIGFFAPDFDGNNGAKDDNSCFATVGFSYTF